MGNPWFVAVFILLAGSRAEGRLIAVSGGSDDRTADGTPQKPFGTIQSALKAAVTGDWIIVNPGTYSGPGNRDLNFGGKGISVRSADPVDRATVATTTIDATGGKVIAAFDNDEGPGTIFEGFTLIGGDSSIAAGRGVGGFFSFSSRARPTTRNLVLRQGPSARAPGSLASLLSLSPTGNRFWNGRNPFHQPSSSTDYYGSGDLDGDGAVSNADLAACQEIVSGRRAATPQADVDGNGIINASDVTLLASALNGGVLPAWWNRLTSRAQRNNWIDRIVALDVTREHPPYTWWNVCLGFASQFYMNTAGYREDAHQTFFNRGEARFNVPMYGVLVVGPQYGHAINAVLTGDNPLEFAHWRFIEPQDGSDVTPGKWDMPNGTTVSLYLPYPLLSGGSSNKYGDENMISFQLSATGSATLLERSAALVVERPAAPIGPADNVRDLWNPFILSSEGAFLYEQVRNDMTRGTDIHLARLPVSDRPTGIPLVRDSQGAAYLLDAVPAQTGTVHLLWKGSSSFIPGVFYGLLDTGTGSLSSIQRVSANEMRDVAAARLLVRPGNELHVLWRENQSNAFNPAPSGIYWTRRAGNSWQPEVSLAPSKYVFPPFDSVQRDVSRFQFDATVGADGRIQLVWMSADSGVMSLKEMRYDGAWSAASTIESKSAWAGGVALSPPTENIVHMAYWFVETGALDDPRSNLFHRTLVGNSWSAQVVIDSTGRACCGRWGRGKDLAHLTWERNMGSQVAPVWRSYTGGNWLGERLLAVQAGSNAWYPGVYVTAAGGWIAWSSRSGDRVSIDTFSIPAVLIAPVGGAVQVPTNAELTWSAVAGATSYDVYLGTVSSPPKVASTTGTTYIANGLSASTRYYWFVVANTPTGPVPTATSEFRTEAITGGLRFVPISPCRLVDTRPPYAGTTWTGALGPPLLMANQQRTIPVAGGSRCGIPASARAFVFNVTLDTLLDGTGPVDFVTIWPTGEARPNFWTVRTTTGGYIANSAIVKAGANGSVNVYSSNNVHLVLDINGYFTEDSTSNALLYYPIGPCRAVDTRGPVYSSLPPPYGNQKFQRGETRNFRIPGSPVSTSSCSIPAASAYSLQMTLAPGDLTNGEPVAYVTAWPSGQAQPTISNMNSIYGYALANSGIVPSRAADGSMSIYASDPTNLILDVNGYFAPDDGTGRGLYYNPVSQCRVVNTQDPAYTGQFGGPQMTPAADRTITLPNSTRCPGLPATARAWALNATAIPGEVPMPFLSMWPAGVAWPGVSQLNAFQGQTVSNAAIVPALSEGSIQVKVNGTTHVAIEVSGYFSR